VAKANRYVGNGNERQVSKYHEKKQKKIRGIWEPLVVGLLVLEYVRSALR
jgi:hypothetical protein